MYVYVYWYMSSDTFLPEMMRKNGGEAEAGIEGSATAFFDLPNSWRTDKIYTTHQTPHSRLCAFVGTGFFRFFSIFFGRNACRADHQKIAGQ